MTTNAWERHIENEQLMRTVLRSQGLGGEHLETLRCYIKGDCRVIVAEEPWKERNRRSRTHLSISCAKRYPTWDEIKDARYSLMGLGLQVAMMLPPLNEYVNIHENTFHLYEINDPEIG